MGNVSPPWPSEPDPQRRSVPQHSQMWASPGYAAGPGEPNAVWAWPPPVQPPRPRTDEPPPGVPYHRMGRTERHRWWRPPLALGCAVPLFLGLNILLVIVVELGKAVQHIPADVAETGHPVADLAVELLLVILLIPAVLFAVRFVQKRRGGSLSSVEGRLRWRWLLRCTAVATACVTLSFAGLVALLLVTEPGEDVLGEYAGTGLFVSTLVVVVLLVPFQAAAEEYALRGFLMQLVGGYGDASRPRRSAPVAWVNRVFTGPVPAILVSGLVFTAMHDYFDWALADVAVFGLAMAWITWYTGGLEAAIALHVIHNVAAFSFAAYAGELDQSGTSGSWQGLLATVVEVGLFCLVVAWMRRRYGVRRTTAGDPAPQPTDPVPSGSHPY